MDQAPPLLFSVRRRNAVEAVNVPAYGGEDAAVVAVVVFHTITPLFPGGNVGVDIFFVLSGFLITRILVGEIDRSGRISFGGFYLRRALRLLPALFVLALTLTVAYIVLLGGEDRRESLLAVLAAVTYTSSPLIASGHNLGSMTHMWSLRSRNTSISPGRCCCC